MNSYPDNADSIILVDNQVWFENPDGTRLFGYSPTDGLVDANGDPITGGGGSSVLKTFRKVLTNAQIKALPTTGIELVAAVAGKAIVPIAVVFHLGWTADYTNIDPTAAINVRIDGGARIAAYVTEAVSGVSDLLAYGASSWAFSSLRQGVSSDHVVSQTGFDDSEIVALPLMIEAYNAELNDFEDGHADNYLVVQGTYLEVDTSNTP